MFREYSARVGFFSLKGDEPVFDDEDLRIPLVRGTLIGRAKTFMEDNLCGEGTNSLRPAYSGEKIVIPNVYGARKQKISKDHGQLVLRPSRGFYYTHRSEFGPTTLWTPEDGIVQVAGPGDEIDLRWPELEESGSVKRYLLLGGKKSQRRLSQIYPDTKSYYVLVIGMVP